MVLETLDRIGLNPDGPAFWLLLLTLLVAVGLLVRALKQDERLKILRDRLEETRIKLASSEAELRDLPRLREELASVEDERSDLEREFAASRARLSEREAAMGQLKERMDTDFRAAASVMLEDAHKAFLQRANETFVRHQELASTDAQKRTQAIDELIKPMRETLAKYEVGLTEMRQEQMKTRGELVGRIGDLAKSANDVRLEAQKLSSALRAGPKVRGRWGEEQLRNVVELAGMTSHVDFIEQASHDDGDVRKQPDMVVNLPGGRVIAVDAKVSINAFLDAVEAETDEQRAQFLAQHANDLRAHVKTLSSREYATSLRDSLDFVVMFVPGENYFSAAMEARPALFQEAFEKKVLIATPTTLIAILKSAAFGWRQEKAAENAQLVAGMAKDLYDSLRKMGTTITGVGKGLENAVKKYNELVGNVETRVMPRARKFADYELPGIEDAIETPPLIENTPREPQRGKDLLLPDDTDQEEQSSKSEKTNGTLELDLPDKDQSAA